MQLSKQSFISWSSHSVYRTSYRPRSHAFQPRELAYISILAGPYLPPSFFRHRFLTQIRCCLQLTLDPSNCCWLHIRKKCETIEALRYHPPPPPTIFFCWFCSYLLLESSQTQTSCGLSNTPYSHGYSSTSDNSCCSSPHNTKVEFIASSKRYRNLQFATLGISCLAPPQLHCPNIHSVKTVDRQPQVLHQLTSSHPTITTI